MRKMLWWGAAGLLASAGAVYLAASHAGQHSAACESRQMVVSSSTLPPSRLNDLAKVVGHGVTAVTLFDELCMSQSCKLTAQPAAEECPEVPVCPPATEASEPIQIEASSPHAYAEDSHSADITAANAQAEGSVGTESHPQFALSTGGPWLSSDESEASVAAPPQFPVCTPDSNVVMPKVEDDADGDAESMPYVEEDSGKKNDAAWPFSAWLYWLKKDATKTGPADEESELVPGAVQPGIPVADPPGQTLLPVAPSTETFTPMAPETPPMDLTAPPAHPVTDAIPPSDSTGAPDCQEDPHYHHQYPGCPYTGVCPYMGASPGQGAAGYPALKDFSPPEPAKPKKKKKKVIKADPTSMLKKLSESLLDDFRSASIPRHSGVDTMECRPTDARLPVPDKNQPY